MMLGRIIARKAAEIMKMSMEVERDIAIMEGRISDLRRSDQFVLLREELVRLIRFSNNINYVMNAGTYDSSLMRQSDQSWNEMMECLNEMELLFKEI